MKRFVKKEKFEVIYIDNYLFVVNKPPNLVTQQTSIHKNSLENLALEWLKEKTKKKKPFIHPIHRLDRPVSGLVIFARRTKMLKKMHELQRKREIKREYVAIVEGEIREDKKILRHFLSHQSHRAKIVSQKEGKEALLELQVLKRTKDQTLISIRLTTGRYHQIRVQLSEIGHPVCGDSRYGAKQRGDRIYLHHHRINFIHPMTKEHVEFVSPLPFFFA